MKKIIYLFMVSSFFIACGSDDDASTQIDPVTGDPIVLIENLVYDESVDGDMSGDNTMPTLISLNAGDNRVVADQLGDPRDIDYAVITVPEGFQLSQVILDDYRAEAGNLAFFAIVSGATFPVDTAAGINPDPSTLLGGITYGSGNLNTDLLPETGMLPGAIGFTGGLPEGQYTFWFNQTGPTSGFTLNFVIEMAQDTAPTSTSFDEAVDGDISGDNTAPTVIDMVVGNNNIISSQVNTPRDIDYFTFTIADGQQLEQLIVEQFTGELAFIGLVNGATFPIDVENDGNPDTADLLGGLVYGIGNVGNDILPETANGTIGQGFTTPLSAGTYTVWLNQTGSLSTANLNFVISSI